MIEINKPKVLVLTSSYPKYYGEMSGNFVYELSSRLKRNFDIFVLAPAYKGSLKFEILDEIKIYRHRQFIFGNVELAYGIGIYENLMKNKLKYLLLPFYFFFQIMSLKRLVKKENINIVHAHWLIPNAFIAVLCKRFLNCNIKIISTILGSDIWGFDNKFGDSLKKYTLHNIDSLSVVSNAIKIKVIELGYDKEVFVYPMGLDTNRFSPLKNDPFLKEKLQIYGPFLLFVGIIVEQKGIRHLIQAMPMVLNEFPDAKLVIVGKGNLKSEMIELTNKLSITKSVVFTGTIPRDDLPHYFATADIFILPSFSEGWPVVVMEALSSGTPTIVSDIPVFKQHENREHLFKIVPFGDSDSVANEIKKLLLDTSKNISITNYLRNYTVENFDWNIVSRNYTSLLNSLV